MRIPILRIGIVPVGNREEATKSLQAFCRRLGYVLGTVVTGRILRDSEQLVQALTLCQLDMGWVAPGLAMELEKRKIATPRLAMVRQNETEYHAALFVRTDSKLGAISDLKRVRVAWVERASASGYLVPLAMLRARGVSLKGAFAQQVFAGSHAEVARMVEDGRADVGANFAHFEPGKAHVLRSSGWLEAGIQGPFRVLATAGPIPTDVMVAHQTMSKEHVRIIQQGFQQIWNHPEALEANKLFHCDRFDPCSSTHLRGLRSLLRLVEGTT